MSFVGIFVFHGGVCFFSYPAVLNVNTSYVGPGYKSGHICTFIMYQTYNHLKKIFQIRQAFSFIYCLIDTGSSCSLRFVFRISGKSVQWGMLNLNSTLLSHLVSSNIFQHLPTHEDLRFQVTCLNSDYHIVFQERNLETNFQLQLPPLLIKVPRLFQFNEF